MDDSGPQRARHFGHSGCVWSLSDLKRSRDSQYTYYAYWSAFLVPRVRVQKVSFEVESGTPLDVALYKEGWISYRSSVKFGRPRGIADASVDYGDNLCVQVTGEGLVDPTRYRVVRDVEVAFGHRATAGSRISERLRRFFGAGFQNNLLMRGGVGWNVTRRVITGSANLEQISHFRPAELSKVEFLKVGNLIVGGGLAGLGVAVALDACGRDFALVESSGVLGGRVEIVRRLLNAAPSTRAPNDDAAEIRSLLRLIESGSAAFRSGRGRLIEGTFTGFYEEKIGLVLCSGAAIAVSFDNIIFANGSRSPVPLLKGNDLPGVISIDYAARLAAHGALRGKTILYSEDRWSSLVGRLMAARGADIEELVQSDRAKIASILGQRRVEAVVFTDGRRKSLSNFVYGTCRQPALELPAQAGVGYSWVAAADILRAEVSINGSTALPWLWAVGSVTGVCELEASYHQGLAAGYALSQDDGRSRAELKLVSVRDSAPAPTTKSADAFVCTCEDVTVRDFEVAAKKGILGPEKTKRFTGWGTGVCQGKHCLYNGLRTLARDGASPYTQRLPITPTPFVVLARLGENAK